MTGVRDPTSCRCPLCRRCPLRPLDRPIAGRRMPHMFSQGLPTRWAARCDSRAQICRAASLQLLWTSAHCRAQSAPASRVSQPTSFGGVGGPTSDRGRKGWCSRGFSE
jgi:hypothetical protein